MMRYSVCHVVRCSNTCLPWLNLLIKRPLFHLMAGNSLFTFRLLKRLWLPVQECLWTPWHGSAIQSITSTGLTARASHTSSPPRCDRPIRVRTTANWWGSVTTTATTTATPRFPFSASVVKIPRISHSSRYVHQTSDFWTVFRHYLQERQRGLTYTKRLTLLVYLGGLRGEAWIGSRSRAGCNSSRRRAVRSV